MPKKNHHTALLAQWVLGVLATGLFITLFVVSDQQHWSLTVTLASVIGLVVAVNMAYICLFWLAKRPHLDEEEDD